MTRVNALRIKLLIGLLLVVSYCPLFIKATLAAGTPSAQRGLVDLRTTDLSEQTVRLNGEWKFYWNRLLTPTDSAGYFEYVDIPKLWTNSTWKQQVLPAQGYASYTLTVLLPSTNESLALTIPEVYSAYHLYANGHLLARNGTPGTTPEATVPYWSQQVVAIPAATDTLRLLLQVANFSHTKGGPNKEISLGSVTNLQAARQTNFAFDIFLAGCLFMGGLFFLGLYSFGHHDKSILYFSLFSILYSYRIVGTKQYVLHSLFPYLSWSLTLHLEYLSLFMGVAMFAFYTRELYPKDVYKIILHLIIAICLVFSVATLVLPTTLFTQLVFPFLVVMIAGIPYTFYVYWLAARNQRPGATYALLSTGSLLIIFMAIIAEYFQIAAPSKFLLFFGYIGFFFLQSLILSFRFASALKKARDEAELGLKTKSEFLSTMSHEIRTPLNSVIGMTHLMLKDGPRPDQKQQLDVLLFSANNLLTIVNDILDFNKIEAGKITFMTGPVDPALIARNIASGYSKSASDLGIELRVIIDPSLTTHVLADHTRMSQVIGNLVQNAVKFTLKGSVTLRLVVEEQTDKDITITFSVEDTGIGIAPDKQKVIFDRFTQVDSSDTRGFSGTGLGLAISKKILEMQEVDLHLISELGAGSTFYFTQTFPLAPTAEIAKPEAPAPQAEKPLQGKNILIVEDNSMNILVAQNFLKRWGAQSEVARNGKEALELLDNTRHDLVLMDLHMPIMDGYESTRLLRERGETIPIVALTANIAQEVEGRVYSIGFNDIVVKPFNPNDLLRVIVGYVQQKNQTQLP
ncbi:response regulator [Telluribacter sp.]|jgi:signal transduction histidine kinase/ActR/RegA family two-component response regulator|uniref:response regulator n=1 Tax=Telluribacter sp. TaxID=1978767 RepID=UPI002E0E7677|nr:response regulator [Telluribacter sp.]